MSDFDSFSGVATDTSLISISIEDVESGEIFTKGQLMASVISQCREIDQQKELIEKLVEVVEFYGSVDNWCGNYPEYEEICQDRGENSIKGLTSFVGGKRARQILNSEEMKKYKENYNVDN